MTLSEAQRLVKSKQRVADHGEVFTPAWMVEDMLDLVKRESERIDSRVLEPACGSGNFLVIAYKQMREIEFEINQRRNETHLKSEIPLTNFRGIELREFPAEVARLALIIAEYQCDVAYRGQKEALQEFLPLDAQNWITWSET